MNLKELTKEDVIKLLTKIGEQADKPYTLYLIGGGSMTLQNMKQSTLDLDIILESQKDFSTLKESLLSLGYSIDESIHEEEVYKNSIMVFLKEGGRIDVFIKSICGMLDFTTKMKQRANTYATYRNLTVKLASNEDIFLLKSLAGRKKDLPDSKNLFDQQLKWNTIVEECVEQHGDGTKWIFWLYEQICRLEDTYGAQSPAKRRIWNICKDNWQHKPTDFLEDSNDKEKHYLDSEYFK